MAKKIMTVTRLKVKGDLLFPNTELDVQKYKLTQDQLIKLHKAGSIKVVDTSEPVDRPELTPADVVTKSSTEENNGTSGDGTGSGVVGTNQTDPDKS
jgi:hypothetical protein